MDETDKWSNPFKNKFSENCENIVIVLYFKVGILYLLFIFQN